ncbi:calcium-binding protein [Phenylobacterium sp.]|uniref:calcium-binding protein n=1 Tax=Phenylobacterium sp. TaxID=1871053 RepID=UPI002735484D|nr:calcium-binding protein [Phenylobacterium sp.]MDP3854324.1 calcium-binding protein [Phenylobacterium sp.]
MAHYAFEDIEPLQALAIRATDSLTMASARYALVLINPLGSSLPDHISISTADRTVVFGAEVGALVRAGRLQTDDGSRLFIGDGAHENVAGAAGADALYGGDGNDTLSGGGGDDFLQGNKGDDSLSGGEGINLVFGGQGDDMIRAADGAPNGTFAHGNMGRDTVIGGGGDDILLGGKDDDSLSGGDGRDFISGDLGDDRIDGGAGSDTLIGADGSDTLDAGGGVDLLLGGAGADRFSLADGDLPASGRLAVIGDWQGIDRLDFGLVHAQQVGLDIYAEDVAGGYAEALVKATAIFLQGKTYAGVQVGTDVLVFANTDLNAADGPETAVVLAGRTLADIDDANFF